MTSRAVSSMVPTVPSFHGWISRWLMAGLAGCGLALQAQPQKIASWSFDPSPNGDAPPAGVARLQSRGRLVPGVSGQGAAFSDREPGDALLVPLPVTSASQAVRPAAMSVRFWYRPDWSTGAAGQAGGPQAWARLLAIGDRGGEPAEGWWELSVNPEGTVIEVSSAAGRAPVYTATSKPVTFQEGQWTEIVINAFAGRVRGFKDGVLVLEDKPNQIPAPRAGALRKGLAIGSRPDGSEGARGALDEIAIFDAPLDRVEVSKRGRVLSVFPTVDGAGLHLRWGGIPGLKVDVQRADGGRTNWVTIGTTSKDQEFQDREIRPGERYEYQLLTNGRPARLDATAGIRIPPIERRGRIALLVDETLANDLGEELNLLTRDLVADGWKVVRESVPRHNDEVWSANTNAIQSIRARVQKLWAEDAETPLRCLYLIGHVAIPYSGMFAEDNHSGRGDNHTGAWPADQYYGDVDGIWADREPYPVYLSATRFPFTHNVPGDGKFDTEFVPPNAAGETRLEVAFGRIDFSGMPLFGRGRRGELDLIRQYLAKVRRYRAGLMPSVPRVIAGAYLNSHTDFDMLQSAYRSGSRLYGFGEDVLFEGDLFDPPRGEAVAWGFQCGEGNVDRIRTSTPLVLTSADLTDPRRQARSLFTVLMGSWFGDWAGGENNLMRAVLCSKDHGLATLFVRKVEWRMDAMALGGTIGDAQLLTANRAILYRDPNRGTTRTLTILGDPTLRLHAHAPPRNVRGSRSRGAVRLTWQASPEADSEYLVYRSLAGWEGPYERITPEPITAREYRDEGAQAQAVYMVRATRLVTTASGSYTNLSVGVYWPSPL